MLAAAALGVGGVGAAVVATQQAATARTGLEESLTSAQTMRTTLAAMVATDRTAINALTTDLTPIATNTNKLCDAIKTASEVVEEGADQAAKDRGRAMKIVTAFQTAAC